MHGLPVSVHTNQSLVYSIVIIITVATRCEIGRIFQYYHMYIIGELLPRLWPHNMHTGSIIKDRLYIEAQSTIGAQFGLVTWSVWRWKCE